MGLPKPPTKKARQTNKGEIRKGSINDEKSTSDHSTSASDHNVGSSYHGHDFNKIQVSDKEQQDKDAANNIASTQETTDFIEEFDVFKKYIYQGEGGVKDAESYHKKRVSVFGEDKEYEAFSKDSDNEIETYKLGKSKLKNKIEHAENPVLQKLLYRWTRVMYFKNGVAYEDIPKLIIERGSKTVRNAIKDKMKDVTRDGKPLRYGGFNPRPEKLDYKYKLGTLSNHAWGKAIDIDDSKNPQINNANWEFMLSIAEKTMDKEEVAVLRNTEKRKNLWAEDPGKLYDHVRNLNDHFKTNIGSKIEEAKKTLSEQESSKKIPSGDIEAKAINEAIPKIHDELRERIYREGFITLEKDLVKQLNERGLVWGVIFKNPDIHHFELPEEEKKK